MGLSYKRLAWILTWELKWISMQEEHEILSLRWSPLALSYWRSRQIWLLKGCYAVGLSKERQLEQCDIMPKQGFDWITEETIFSSWSDSSLSVFRARCFKVRHSPLHPTKWTIKLRFQTELLSTGFQTNKRNPFFWTYTFTVLVWLLRQLNIMDLIRGNYSNGCKYSFIAMKHFPLQ